MGEREEVAAQTVEVRQGVIDLIVTSYKDMKGFYESLALKYKNPNGELRTPKNPMDAYELGNVAGLMHAYKLVLELAGQKEKVDSIDLEVTENLAATASTN